jgi:hypothetical protein
MSAWSRALGLGASLTKEQNRISFALLDQQDPSKFQPWKNGPVESIATLKIVTVTIREEELLKDR